MTWDDSTVYTLWGFVPMTRVAVDWVKLADGNWNGSDRGVSEDVYEAAIVFKGTEAELSTLETELNTNKENFNLTCGTGEEIFGADVDYSGAIDVTVVDYGTIQSVNRGVYSMPLKLRALSHSNTGSASISNLRLASHRFEPNSLFDLDKSFTLDGTATYLNGETDPGIFHGVFKQTQTEMKAIRRYLLTTARTASVSFPSFGVDSPFGQRMGSGSFNCKVISWRDMGRKNYADWELDITFARVI